MKRNQVERAIEIVMSGGRTKGRPMPPALRVRIKRLIETDRDLAIERHDAKQPGYAFFDAPPPGRGTEVTYSAFGAFALLLAVRLMDAGLPQSEAVIFVRRLREDLEREHARILRQGWQKLLDHPIAGDVDDEVKIGRLVKTFDRMVFLVALGGEQVSVRFNTKGPVSGANIVRGTKAMTELMAHLASWAGGAIICLELVNPAHQLAYWLAEIEPIKRGRK